MEVTEQLVTIERILSGNNNSFAQILTHTGAHISYTHNIKEHIEKRLKMLKKGGYKNRLNK